MSDRDDADSVADGPSASTAGDQDDPSTTDPSSIDGEAPASDTDHTATAPDGADRYPPLDVVDSRWWYWIAAYPIVTLLFVPLVILLAVLFLAPALIVSPNGAPRAFFGLMGIVLVVVILAIVMTSLLVFLLLPVALYMDARAVGTAPGDWEPDPLLYGLLGLLQFLTTPLVGLVVAVYYLYQRHVHVGIP